MHHGIVKSEQVVGVNVQNTAGDDLGKVEEIILDKNKGNVRYVVLSYGGFLGMGDKLFALPWEVFSYNDDEDCFVINVKEETLKNSEGFDKDNWPNFSDPQFGTRLHSHYGTTPRA